MCVCECESGLVKVISGAINYAIIDSKGFITFEKNTNTHTHIHTHISK